MNITQLRHFELVVETGSFAAAAQRAHITQPALSNSIRVLEDRLGVRLFDRSARPARLTAAGRELRARAQILLNEVRNLERTFTHIAQGDSGHLRVGMTGVSSASVGGQILGQWTHAGPGRSADVMVAATATLLEHLRAERLDAIIGDTRDLPANVSDIDLTALPALPGGAFCRAGHPLLDKPDLTPADLPPYGFAGPHLPERVLDGLARAFGLPHRRDLQITVDSDNLSLLRDAVIHSDLVLLSVRSSVENAIRAGAIRQLHLDIDMKAIWAFASLRNAVPHPALPSLKQAVQDVFARFGPGG